MKKRILIVDDEPDQVFTVQKSIEASSDEFEVFSATSGEQSIEFLQKHEPPDLILLDIMMPGMDGWELLNRIQENYKWSKIPVIFLTAKIDDFTKTFARSVAMDFIEKPFEIHDLKKRIDFVLKKAYDLSILEQ